MQLPGIVYHGISCTKLTQAQSYAAARHARNVVWTMWPATSFVVVIKQRRVHKDVSAAVLPTLNMQFRPTPTTLAPPTHARPSRFHCRQAPCRSSARGARHCLRPARRRRRPAWECDVPSQRGLIDDALCVTTEAPTKRNLMENTTIRDHPFMASTQTGEGGSARSGRVRTEGRVNAIMTSTI